MKRKYSGTLAICFLVSLVFLLANQGQNPQWKGKIEEEEGIKVIKNPEEPLYGEIKFELEEDLSIGNEEDENYLFYKTWHLAVDRQGNIYVLDGGNIRIQVFDKNGRYLRTIGRKGQGPGEFQSPQGVFINDKKGEVYVPDFRSIKVFASNGNYLKTIPLESFNSSYCISPNGIILGETDKITFDENNTRETKKYFTSLRLINNRDGSETAIASYPSQLSKIIEGGVAKFSHGYEHRLYMCAIGPQMFIYGFSSDYNLNIIDSAGKLLLKIQKESPVLSISEKEKDIVREKFRDSPIKNVNNIPFPRHKPHFEKILADGDWIFIEHYKSPQEQGDVWSYDVFNTQGFYLYKLSFPLSPYLIKNGYVYLIKVLEEKGDVLVKRYKIKNWEQIKTGF
jgi:hypothetical protein